MSPLTSGVYTDGRILNTRCVTNKSAKTYAGEHDISDTVTVKDLHIFEFNNLIPYCTLTINISLRYWAKMVDNITASCIVHFRAFCTVHCRIKQ